MTFQRDFKIKGILEDIKIYRSPDGAQVNKLSISTGSSIIVREPYFGHISDKEAAKMKGQSVTFVQKYTQKEGRFCDLSNSFINQALIGKGYQGALGILVSKASDLYKVAYDIYNQKTLREIFDH
jgi:hypothetical protein